MVQNGSAFHQSFCLWLFCFFFFQAEDGIRDHCVTGVQTCALPISRAMGFEPELFEVTDEELAAEALRPFAPPRRFPAPDVFEGITLGRLLEEGPVRLDRKSVV